MLTWGFNTYVENVLGFLEMFGDSHIWLQITPKNQMSGEFGFLPWTPLSRNMIPFKTGGYSDFQD